MRLCPSPTNTSLFHSYAVMFLLTSLLALALPACTQPPGTHLRLIAAMPRNCESVMLIDYQALLCADSIYQGVFAQNLESLAADRKPHEHRNLGHLALQAAVRAEPLLHAQGGSDFTTCGSFPDDIEVGPGQYTQRGIWIVRNSLADFEKSLETSRPDGAVTAVERTDAAYLYQGTADADITADGDKAETTLFVAFLDDRTLLYANSRADLLEILQNLRHRNPVLPPQWAAAAADIDPETALVLILRRFDRSNTHDMYSPVNPIKPAEVRIDIDSLALTISNATEPTFLLNVLTNDPDRASAWLMRDWLGTVGGDSEPTETGLKCNLCWNPDPVSRDYHEALLILYLIFGMNIVI